jgi:DNA repair exonuclease SbcCD nuclease subunit
MNKYLYFQDGHGKGVNPASRIDNYSEAWFTKLKEIFLIAKQKKVDAIIDGGDLLDIPMVSYALVDKILDLIEETGIPVYCLWGNHALIGHHIETSNGTSLRHMFRRCKLLIEAEEDIVEKSHVIKFIDYDHNIEERIKKDGIIFNNGKPEPKWHVAIVHAFITPKPFLPTVLHVMADDIKTNADLVLVAHYHAVWEKQCGKTKFLDIGCMGRCAISEAQIHPSVLFLDFSAKSESINYEVIPLKSAKKGSEVFDLEAKAEAKSNEKEMERFIDSLRDFKQQDLDLRGTIEYIGKEQKVARPVLDRINEKLTEVGYVEASRK